MPSSDFPVPAPVAAEVLAALFDVSLTGVLLLRPVFAPADPARIVDWAYVRLNPAAQRLLGLPECPAESFLALNPGAAGAGVFAFYGATFGSGEPGRYAPDAPHEGPARSYQLAARRSGELLVVSFTDPTGPDPDRRRAAQAADAARWAELDQLFEQAPVAVALFEGPRHVVRLANPAVLRMWGRTRAQALGTPLFELLPEAAGQGFEELLAGVLATGVPYVAHELPSFIDRQGRHDTVYWNFVYLPRRAATGQITGVTVVAIEVSEQVQARLRIEQLNADMVLTNAGLADTVAARTQALAQAQAETEAQRGELRRVFEQAPVLILVLRGPRYVFELANPVACQLLDRPVEALLGQGFFEAVPETAGLGFEELLDGVMQTGVPYVAHESLVHFRRGGRLETTYWNFVYHPLREADGQISGIIVVATEVTAQVLARQQNEALQAQALAAAELAAAQREAFYLVFDQAPAGIALYREPGLRIEYVNAAYQRLFPGRQLMGRTVAEAVPEAVAQGFAALLSRVFETGETYVGQEELAVLDQPDGQPPRSFYFDYIYQPVREGGRTVGVSVFVTDATERVLSRRQAEAAQAAALAAAEQTVAQRAAFYQVFEQTPALIVLLRGPEHRIDYFNAAYQQVFAGRAQRGRRLAETAPETERQGFVALLDRVYETGETHFGVEMPFTAEMPDGQPTKTHYFNFTYQRFEENGQPAGISVFAYDVAGQVLARRERETQQRQLEELFMQAPTPIVILDGPGLVFQLVNPAYQRIFPGRALLGKALLDALPELAGTAIPGLLRRVYDTGEPYTDQELPLQMARHEGAPPEEIHWTFTYQARRDEHGAVDGVRVFAHDVSQPVQARQLAEANRQQVGALNQQLAALNDKLFAANAALAEANEGLGHANQQLTRTNADLDSFVYTASHDLKEPMTNVEGLLAALYEELPPAAAGPSDAVQHLLRLLQDAVRRFHTTLDQLTDIVRLRDAPVPTESVDLAALIADICLDLAPQLAAADARLTTELDGCPRLTFAPRHLRSIVYNLLSNAVKYRHPNRPPLVHIRCRSTATATLLAVQDNGLGLSPAQQGQLFGLFRRLHNHVEGAGIGLYTLKKIVENAGGTITVESELGAGSTFTVALPAPAAA